MAMCWTWHLRKFFCRFLHKESSAVTPVDQLLSISKEISIYRLVTTRTHMVRMVTAPATSALAGRHGMRRNLLQTQTTSAERSFASSLKQMVLIRYRKGTCSLKEPIRQDLRYTRWVIAIHSGFP